MANYTTTTFPKRVNDQGFEAIHRFLTSLINHNPLYSSCRLRLQTRKEKLIEGYIEILQTDTPVVVEFQLCDEWFTTRAPDGMGYPKWIQRSLHKFFHNRYGIPWIPDAIGEECTDWESLPVYLGKAQDHTQAGRSMILTYLPQKFKPLYQG